MGTEIPEDNPLLTRPIGPHVIWPFCLISFPTTHFSPSPRSLHHIALSPDASPSLLCLVHSNPLFQRPFMTTLCLPTAGHSPPSLGCNYVSENTSVCSVPGDHRVRTDLSKYPGSHVLAQDSSRKERPHPPEMKARGQGLLGPNCGWQNPRQASLRVVVGSLGESSQNFIFGEVLSLCLDAGLGVCVCVCVCRGWSVVQRHLALGGGLEEDQ